MILTEKLRRPSALAVAALLLLTSLVPLLSNSKVSAYALLGPRQIKMSSTNISQTGVSYRVKFQITTESSNLGGIVVAFCEGADSPIIGDAACTVPAGFSLTGATVNGQSDGTTVQDDEDAAPLATADITTLTTVNLEDLDDSAATAPNTITLSNATAVSNAAIDAGDYITFNINGVTNPSDVGTFYARIYTYDTQAEAQGYTLANPDVVGASIDAGGIALSTAQQITVTAKVQERLTFCVYAADATGYANNDCVDKTSTGAITLGDTNGVLDPAGPYVDKTARYSITTNASGNAVIRAKGNTLTSGSFTIDPVGGGTVEAEGNDVAAQTAAAIEQFGFCSYQEPGGSGGLSVDTEYDGQAAAGTDNCADTFQSAGTSTPSIRADDVAPTPQDVNFAFITAELGSTYGSRIATKAAGAFDTGTLAFIGNINNTTEAGIYTTVLTFIATGTY